MPARFPVFDLHCDTADRLAWHAIDAEFIAATGMPAYGPGDADAPEEVRDLAQNRCHVSLERIGDTRWAQCFACFIPDELSPEQAVRFYGQVASNLDEQLARHAERIVDARDAAAVRAVLEGGASTPHVAAVRTIENARLFAADLGLVEGLSRDGLLMASLTWNAAGPLASGVDGAGGLTPLGRTVLAELERCGVALDISHLNDEGTHDALARSTRPVAASHSNSRAVCNHPRNLTDRQFLEVCETGGVVGLNYCQDFLVEEGSSLPLGSVTFDHVAAHIEHWLELGGEDVIALGGDFDGADVPVCIATAAEMPSFQELLLARFGETVTHKLCYENALSFFERVARV